jgi:hypothetical protein
MDKKKNLASAIRAVRTGGKALSDITGNPEDAAIQPRVSKKQRRIGELVDGFTRLGGK